MDWLQEQLDKDDESIEREWVAEAVWFGDYVASQSGRVYNSKLYKDFNLWLDGLDYKNERPTQQAFNGRLTRIIKKEGYQVKRGRIGKERYLYFP